MGEEYNRLAEMLLGAHIDFDFGDEILLSQDGKVREGALILGQASVPHGSGAKGGEPVRKYEEAAGRVSGPGRKNFLGRAIS